MRLCAHVILAASLAALAPAGCGGPAIPNVEPEAIELTDAQKAEFNRQLEQADAEERGNEGVLGPKAGSRLSSADSDERAMRARGR